MMRLLANNPMLSATTQKRFWGRVLEHVPFLLVVLVAVLVQATIISQERIHWNSDQAVVGIMARDILTRGAHPVFYYGATYSGTLEAHWVALVFALLGISIQSYRIAMVALAVFLICIVYFTARIRFSSGIALLAAGYLALPPWFFFYKGLTSDGSYDAMTILGALLVYSALRLEDAARQGNGVAHWFAMLGFLAGVGWWVSPQTASFDLAVLIWLLIFCPAVFTRATHYAVALATFLVGSFPWWFHNMRYSWHSLTTPELAHAGLTKAVTTLHQLWTLGLPILLGSRLVFRNYENFPGENFAAAFLYLVPAITIAVYIWKHRQTLRHGLRETDSKARAMSLILFLLILIPAVVSASAWTDLGDPRFLFPLYSVYPIAFAFAASKLLSRRKLLAIIGAGLISLAVFSTARALWLKEQYRADTDPANNGSLAELIRALDAHGLREAYASYWTAYRLPFESQERIIATPFGQWALMRVRRYREVVNGSQRPAFILSGAEAEAFLKFAQTRGARFEQFTLGPFQVFYDLDPKNLSELRRYMFVPAV